MRKMTKLMKKIIGMMICSFGLTTCAAAIEEPPKEAQEILEYWFGSLQTAEVYPKDKAKQWFGGGTAVDNDIRNRFEELVRAATKNELAAWKETAKGRLALIILVDQFTRNIYRGTPQAFAYDSIAQELTLEGIIQGHDQALFPIERVFFYLPLEHSENIEIQGMSVEKFHAILPAVPPEHASHFISFENYAQRHYEIIAKFGRFPHRNEILSRESTPEEVEFLKDPKASF
jgi:uncharacterized protein (DUF924 family)